MLLTKRAHQCTIIHTFSALMTVHPMNYAIFHNFSVIKDNSSVFFLAQTSYSLDKNSPSKWDFLDFWVVGWKFTKFLMSFLEPRNRFSFNFASLLSARKHNSSVFCHLNFICFGKKDLIQVQIFRLSTACMKINRIPYVIFQATCQFSFKICINFQCHDT